jgi:hypothetical protein
MESFGGGIPSALGGAAGGHLPDRKTVTTETVQRVLDENQHLIMAVLENQKLGKIEESTKYVDDTSHSFEIKC